MNRLLTILSAFSALLAATPFIRPRTRGGQTIFWLPKLVAGALSLVAGTFGALTALTGFLRRDWKLAGAGLLGFGLAARLVSELPNVAHELAALPGPRRATEPSAQPESPDLAPRPARAPTPAFERDVIVGHKPVSGAPLLADLWLPADGRRSGLGLIYVHGSGWRVGDKDMGTRPFFRRLARQGHVILDLSYSLWPSADMASMVMEVNQAILWLKEHGPAYGFHSAQVVLIGASAGAHLALLAAYTPGHPAFRPAGAAGDTSVRGVVAFYPPVDLLSMNDEDKAMPSSPAIVDRLGRDMMKRFFRTQDASGDHRHYDHFLAEMLGGKVEDIPDTYRLLSPIYHVGPHCPPTLLIQGSDDVFGLAHGARRLHQSLGAAGAPSVMLEFPHTEHAFDLILPHISPTAQRSTRGVELFLAHLA